MDRSLGKVIEDCGIIDINNLFKKVLTYGCAKLTCKAGSAFLFDRATNRLKLRASTWGSHNHFSISPGQGIAGKAYTQKDQYLVTDASKTPEELIRFIPFPLENFRVSVAMPLCVNNKVEAIFCFYFEYATPEELSDKNGLFTLEKKQVDVLWGEFRNSLLGRAIHRIQMHGIPGRIHEAGQSAARLTTEVSKFISRLQEICKECNQESPNLMYLQLKDPSRNVIQTIQGFSAHQKLERSSSHLLDSEDINAFIVKNRCVEIISGHDPVRFDPIIYEEHKHHLYTRLWMPLFPFPMTFLSVEGPQDLEGVLAEMMQWEEPKTDPNGMVSQVGNWLPGYLPPEELVYGVLELGFLLKNPEKPTVSPWSPAFAMEIMSKVFKESIPLYRSTLPGVMDCIGRLLANSPISCKVKFECQYPGKGRKEIREYPFDTNWPVAVPITGFETEKLASSGYRFIYPPEHELVKIEFIPNKDMSPPKGMSQSYYTDIWEQNASSAGKAMETAFMLYDAVLAPIMLTEREKDRSNLGTTINDRVVQTLIADAARSNGAKYAAFFSFERQSMSDGENKYQNSAVPVVWSGEIDGKIDIDIIQDLAYETAESHSSNYPPFVDLTLPICFLPFKLKEGSIGVIVLGFQAGYCFKNSIKRDLERQAQLWRHRISLHLLILEKRFSSMMMQFRRSIIQAKEAAVAESPKKNPMETFMEQILSSAIDHLKVKAAAISLYQKFDTGPSRLNLYWKEKQALDPTPLNAFEFFNIETHISCSTILGDNTLKIIDDEACDTCTSGVDSFLKDYADSLAKDVHEKDKQAEMLRNLADICQDKETQSILIFPIQEENSYKPDTHGRFYLFMPEKHFYRDIHKKLTNELGQLVGLTITQVKMIQEENYRAVYSKNADNRIIKFERATNIDEIIHIFLQGLGRYFPEKSETELDKEEYLNIAEDAVIWILSQDSQELVARSGRGKVLDALRQDPNSIDILSPKEHPIFKEYISSMKKVQKHYPVLREEFKLWTFDLDGPVQNHPSSRLFEAYRKGTGRKWLISFFLVDPADKIFGVIDLLRDEPLNVQTENVLKHFFLRISRRLNSAAEKVRLRRVNMITEHLFKIAKTCIEQAKTFEVYGKLANLLKIELHCEQCDIFVKKQGKYFLYASTHKDGPKDDRQRALNWFKEDVSHQDIFGKCLETYRPCICHEWDPTVGMDHLSVPLRQFLDRVHYSERMILPLTASNGHETPQIEGFVQLHCPGKPGRPGGQPGYLNKNNRFTAEDYRLGKDIGSQLRRIIRMVQLAEQQSWLVNEVGHSLNQPLQVLRSFINQPIRALFRTDFDRQEIRNMLDSINQSYEMVHEAINQLSYFTGIHGSEWEYKEENIKKLIEDCCVFMAETARNRKLLIDYSRLAPILPLPIDRAWMRKALLNLIHNACKYSWANEDISVSLSEEEGKIHISVSNHGIGIPEKDMDRIFEAYFRSLVEDRRGARPGTGIGLPIVKNAVETIHQGQVLVISNPVSRTNNIANTIAEDISDILYKTTFTIVLDRNRLENLRTRSIA